jgi:signal transduction histidine kinase
MAMPVPAQKFPWIGKHPRVTDVVVSGAVLAASLFHPGETRNGGLINLSVLGAALSIVACLSLVMRREKPLLVLGITTGAFCLYTLIGAVKSPIGLAMGVAVYTVVLNVDRYRRIVALTTVAIVATLCATVGANGDLLKDLSVVVLLGLAVAVGEAMRNRRAYLAEIQNRIRQAEQAREEEADRRVMEERIRIAHELHDVIAHHIALMNVQAGVAAHMLREQPEESERALALVRDGGRTVLQELTVLLGVLRRSGDSTIPTAPSPSLEQLGTLIESFAAAGLQIEWEPYEPGEALPELIGLTAYRVLQESLTNVVKHTNEAKTTVQISRRPGELDLDVTNTAGTALPRPVGATAPIGSGHGLIGMRERVATVGGTVSAGPTPEGGFRVHAILPLQEGVGSDDPSTAGGRPDPDPPGLPGACRLGS